MPRTTPIHEKCGTCTECARNPQIIKYKCEKGGSYRLLTGYVGKIEDVCIKPEKNIFSTVMKCIIVGQIAGFVVFCITNNPVFATMACIGLSVGYFIIE